MRLLIRICFLFTVLLVTSCENYIMYHSYKHIPSDGWNKSDTLLFDLSLADSLANNYNIHILIRNRANYQFQQLNLAVIHNYPDTTTWNTKQLSFDIADNNGNWKGKGISGLYESIQSLTTGVTIPRQAYQFKVVSLMNDSILSGINDIGILAKKE